MPKKEIHPDTAIVFFVVKVVGSVALAFLVAIGIDVSHALESVNKLYGQSV